MAPRGDPLFSGFLGTGVIFGQTGYVIHIVEYKYDKKKLYALFITRDDKRKEEV